MISDKQIQDWVDDLNKELSEVFEKQFTNLKWKPITINKGRNRVKLVRDNGVWGFISLVDDPKLGAKPGDLLKAASWNAPAKHPRGNILDGTARYKWTGPEYLK